MQARVRHSSTEETVFANTAKRNLCQHWSLSQCQPGEEHGFALARSTPIPPDKCSSQPAWLGTQCPDRRRPDHHHAAGSGLHFEGAW